ncbi:MAG TPA: hypothetical protein VFV87_22370 [Pirellulaceae bacterium]|nr:hypothetical protein [Pirellulaceae bacterium]
MDETRKEDDASAQGLPGATRSSTSDQDPQSIAGLEINLGDFTRTQVLMRSLRLTLNNQIVVQVEEIASGVSEAGRKFKLGDVEQANLDVARLYAAFDQKTNQWESQARNLQQQMKAQAAKNPRSISIDKMNQMKAEQTAVRTRIRTAEVQFRRLHQGLEQAFTILQSQPPPATSAAPADLPPGFLARFEAAASADRPAVVRELFEIEAELKVSVTRGKSTGYEIRFSPTPAKGRLYFLTTTAQIIRLEQIGNSVVILDLVSGEETEMKLSDFVKRVQAGASLLQPR